MKTPSRTIHRILAILSTLLLAAPLTTTVTACGLDCEVRSCDDLVKDSSLTTNGKDYQHCLSCYSDGTCLTVLKDPDGKELYSCQDEVGKSCTESVVNAEFAYCDVQ